MTPEERQALREKHREIFDDYGSICDYCDRCGCGEYYVEWPCDVIKVLDALEEANFQAAINYERGYDDGFKGSVADAEWDHWCDGVNDDQP